MTVHRGASEGATRATADRHGWWSLPKWRVFRKPSAPGSQSALSWVRWVRAVDEGPGGENCRGFSFCAGRRHLRRCSIDVDSLFRNRPERDRGGPWDSSDLGAELSDSPFSAAIWLTTAYGSEPEPDGSRNGERWGIYPALQNVRLSTPSRDGV